MLTSKQISKISDLKASGLSDRKISKKLGISRNTLSKYSNPKIVKPILQRHEIQAEKIETIKEEIKDTRQDSKTIRKQLKRARKQQNRAHSTHYKIQIEADQEAEETGMEKIVSDIINNIPVESLWEGWERKRQEKTRKRVEHQTLMAEINNPTPTISEWMLAFMLLSTTRRRQLPLVNFR